MSSGVIYLKKLSRVFLGGHGPLAPVRSTGQITSARSEDRRCTLHYVTCAYPWC